MIAIQLNIVVSNDQVMHRFFVYPPLTLETPTKDSSNIIGIRFFNAHKERAVDIWLLDENCNIKGIFGLEPIFDKLDEYDPASGDLIPILKALNYKNIYLMKNMLPSE